MSVVGGVLNASETSCSKSQMEKEGTRRRKWASPEGLRKTCMPVEGSGEDDEADMDVDNKQRVNMSGETGGHRRHETVSSESRAQNAIGEKTWITSVDPSVWLLFDPREFAARH